MKTTGRVVLGMLALAGGAGAAEWFVDGSKPSGGSGLSWGAAFNTIQAAVNAAETAIKGGGGNGVYQVWVTNGTYAPFQCLNLPVRIESVNGADWTSVDGNGTARCATLGAVGSGITNTVLAGFTLTNGFSSQYGGGALCGTLLGCTITMNRAGNQGFSAYGEGGGVRGAVLFNCTVSGNKAGQFGGGAYACTLYDCTLTGNSADSGGGAFSSILHRCTLSENAASNSGGGASGGVLYDCLVATNTAVSNGGGASDATLHGCTLTGNQATGTFGIGGGARMCTLNNCALTGNTALDGGGADGGTLNNCLLAGNAAGRDGGAVFGGTYWGEVGCILNNCTVVSNTAAGYGGGVQGGARVSNSILWGNSAGLAGDNYNEFTIYNYQTRPLPIVFQYSCTTPLPPGPWNIDDDPLFADAPNGDFRVQTTSPCLNAGKNVWFASRFDIGAPPAYWVLDEYAIPPDSLDPDGRPRIRHDVVDQGAYEIIAPPTHTRYAPVRVPYAWLDLYGGAGSGFKEYEQLAKDTGANGYPYWESYVAGCDPTDPSSKFLITNITVKANNAVTLKWSPDKLRNRTYTVSGMTNLTDTAWHSPTNSATRFYRVNVKLLE